MSDGQETPSRHIHVNTQRAEARRRFREAFSPEHLLQLLGDAKVDVREIPKKNRKYSCGILLWAWNQGDSVFSVVSQEWESFARQGTMGIGSALPLPQHDPFVTEFAQLFPRYRMGYVPRSPTSPAHIGYVSAEDHREEKEISR